MNSGLTKRDVEIIKDIFNKYPLVTLVYIFGSRAKGTYKPGSDIDLAIMNEGLNPDTLIRLRGEFEESSLPYAIDLVNYPELENKDMQEHINRVGVKFYERGETSS